MFKRILWRLASPYDAYVSHVTRLEDALTRIRVLSDRADGYEMGLRSSVRHKTGESDAVSRAERFRSLLGDASETMEDEQLERFLAELGGGETANVDQDRADIAIRLDHATEGMQEYFAVAGSALQTLEQRDYEPGRRDIARQLASNRISPRTLAEYHDELHELARAAGHPEGALSGG
jgi:hypothetical protein